jgi:DNA-binding response OmpR family regulator
MKVESHQLTPLGDILHRGDFLNSPEKSSARYILVAEDDEGIRQLLFSTLIDAGYRVGTAPDGMQAWEALHRKHYDLLITDNDMPNLTGLELIKRIRNAGLILPIMMVSGAFSVESERKNKRLQITAIVRKPFGIPELCYTVREVLASRQVERSDPQSILRS